MSPEWLGTLNDACATMRKWARRPEADEAIRWFNEEYSDRAVRQRRAEAEPDPPLCRVDRPSARQLLGVGPDESSVAWRIYAALFDLSSEETPGECTPWVKRSERIVHALKLLLVVSLAVDADVEEYLGDRLEIATLPIGTDLLERHTRGYAAFLSGLYSGDLPWPERLSEALRQLREAEATHGWAPPSAGGAPAPESTGRGDVPEGATTSPAADAIAPEGKPPAETTQSVGVGADNGGERPPDVPAGRDEPPAPALTANQRRVLRTLALFHASVLVSADVIATEMDPEERLSARTIGPIVKKLIELDLAERPEGERNGARLTMLGRRLAAKIAD